jgi:hypothetical protein
MGLWSGECQFFGMALQQQKPGAASLLSRPPLFRRFMEHSAGKGSIALLNGGGSRWLL